MKLQIDTSFLFLATLVSGCSINEQPKPNIIIINADDLGYGDLSAYGTGSVITPNFDRLAKDGIMFTNVHSTSATSTPSRFSLLTGMYAWRFDGTGVASGDAGMIIRPEMQTIPSMLKRVGYKTAAIGKWHLGIGDKTGEQNWNGEIKPGLNDIGFDYSYIMAATADRVPCVFIEQGRVVNLDPDDPLLVSYVKNFEGEPTAITNPELLKIRPSHGHDQTIVNGISRIGYMKGAYRARWVDENIADTITNKAVNFIVSNKNNPFFLYFATNDVHVPRVPHERFQGKSGLGPRGDAILEFDWSVGQIVKALKDNGLYDNTLLIVTSDNGPVVDDGYADMAWELIGDHRPWGWMRGAKYSVYEAGTRVPMLLCWNGHTQKGITNNAMLSQIDLYASIADIVKSELCEDEARDSRNYSNAFLGKDLVGRNWIVEHGYTYAILEREGWKYIEPSDGMQIAWQTGIDTGCRTFGQLFNICCDSTEGKNLMEEYSNKYKELKQILDSVKNAE